ncbi:class I SAM-dependent methyltransferase [Methanospirillum lacunae]|uniref:Methyltransferase type 11 domain-containing protein n=1 Tax=Methanospirillum lacunae TaxID=668570 RepID=A0A2V2MXB9_9EURY|nr:methyltransferase domain-containing protein [Methanospirillum lacunae]PWR70880.1 hypothetical protein DK846_12880 [Methanospirillum lacunae]
MSEFFEKRAIVWDKDPRRVLMSEAIGKAMVHRINPEKTDILLDYGTGTGAIALQFAKFVRKIIAVDSAEAMLDVLKKKLTDERDTIIEPRHWSIEDDITILPQVDIITSSMVLHHIKNTEQAARVFYSLIKPGGRIAIADLKPDDGEFHEPGIAEHDGFSQNFLADLFRSAGFSEIEFEDIVTISKTGSKTKTARDFTVFLMTATREHKVS